jgi:hypothetical protein
MPGLGIQGENIMKYSKQDGIIYETNHEIRIMNWWNTYSSLEQRQKLCKLLKWDKGHAEGEASLEWFSVAEMRKLLKVTDAQLEACA